MHSAPGRVLELIETFERNIEALKKQPYSETQLRREFLDPFFEALGWDVANKSGYAPADPLNFCQPLLFRATANNKKRPPHHK